MSDNAMIDAEALRALAGPGKPTPGPWEAIKGLIEGDGMRCAVVAVRGKMQYLVAQIENGAPGDICDTEWANARIMAASLAMNEALEAIDEFLTEELAARGLTEGDELFSLLVVPRNIARNARALAHKETDNE